MGSFIFDYFIVDEIQTFSTWSTRFTKIIKYMYMKIKRGFGGVDYS
jgi:hypothetical protein